MTYALVRKSGSIIIGRLEFGYLFDGVNARVEYYVNSEPQNDWFDLTIKEAKQVYKKEIIENKQYKNMNNTRSKVRLTESQLHDVIKESIIRIINESNRLQTPYYIKLFHEQYGGVRGAATCYIISKGKDNQLEQALIDYAKDLNMNGMSPKQFAHYLRQNYPKVGYKSNVIKESDFHRAYKGGKNLDLIHSSDGTYSESDVWECLAELKKKLRQAEQRAKMPIFGNEGETRNYLVGAIRGLQAFIDSRA